MNVSESLSVDLSPILVIGISGRIGSGASFVRDKILQSLRTFQYEGDVIDVTKLMEDFRHCLDEEELRRIDEEVAETEEVGASDKAKRIRRLQLTGNSFRWHLGNSILAALGVNDFIIPDINDRPDGFGSRRAYVFDSLKHPEEVRLLRQIFGRQFWHVGVVASDMTRFDRLKERKHCDRSTFDYLSEEDGEGSDPRDTEKKRKNGQHTIKAVLGADYFFANDFSTKNEIEAEAARLTQLIFGIQVVSPTRDEIGMNAAHQASLRSACLSRQVGAAIVSESGELLSIGHNDVPKFGGGTYGPGEGDHRCWSWGAKCYNDEEKGKITDGVVEELIRGALIEENKRAEATKTLTASRIKTLIEFSRAVHAEMEAIITIARLGISGLLGSTLYSTTYPCHNCAKHIVDAGIKRVVYLEPYEKSLARSLHADAINDPLQAQSDTKVSFDNYGGVAPRRFNAAFEPVGERKRRGEFEDKDRERHGLLPKEREEVSVISQRLIELQQWVDNQLSPGNTPEEVPASAKKNADTSDD